MTNSDVRDRYGFGEDVLQCCRCICEYLVTISCDIAVGSLSSMRFLSLPFWCNWFFYLLPVPVNYELTKPRALFFVCQSYLARLAKCSICVLQKKNGLCSKICIRSSEKCDSLISKSQNGSWWRGWGKLPKQEYLILALSKCGILICHGLFVSNTSSDEKKHANKKNPTPYLEFNKILHLILFSFFEKFNMNTQVLHSFKLWGSCWSGSCAALMCQVPR